ncbi:Protocadherin Fat 2 [Manis pentadactyla]|nr:Protocadherin Fat 2 [Manis pentadactyla]
MEVRIGHLWSSTCQKIYIAPHHYFCILDLTIKFHRILFFLELSYLYQDAVEVLGPEGCPPVQSEKLFNVTLDDSVSPTGSSKFFRNRCLILK